MPRVVDVDLHLELVEPIRGYVREADGRRRAFTGWLEFNSALQHLIEEEGTKQSGDGKSEHGEPG